MQLVSVAQNVILSGGIILFSSWDTRFIGPIAFVLFCFLAFVFVATHGSIACCVTMMTTYGIPC